MNSFDVLILLSAGAAAYGGYRLGFVARAASWIGMALGLYGAARLLPTIVEAFGEARQANLLVLAAGVLVLGAFAGQAAGLVVGARLHFALPRGTARRVDRGAGAVLGVIGVVAALWLLLPAMAAVPDWPSQQARNSAIARAIDSSLPEAPDALRALRQLFGEDNFPEVFDALRPAPALGPPPAETGMSREVAAAIARSTVKVEGLACHRVQDGSGSVVAPDLVVTNAHVVAGESDTVVEREPDGARLDATVVAFDSDHDLALLYVPGIDRAPLPIAAPSEGQVGGVFGHPGGAPLRVAPFQIADVSDTTGTDIYDSHRISREVLFLSSALMPGDSGAAVVTPDGALVGVAFAIAPDRPGVAYALSSSEVEKLLTAAGGARSEVDTGPCLG